jgi:hypothetical protein
MRTQSVAAVAIAGLFAIAVPAAAQAQDAGGWSVSFDVGLDSSWKGDIYNRAQGNLQAQPVQISARSNSNAYPRGLGWSVGISKGLSSRASLRIRAIGTMISSERDHTGRVGTTNVNGTLFSDVDDLSEVGADVGILLHFRSGGTVQPYIGGFAGMARVSAIGGTFDVPDATFTFNQHLDLYSDSTAATGGASMGLLFKRSDRFSWYVNFDLKWRGKLKQDDGDLAGTNLTGLNDDSDRMSMPLSVGVKFGF